MRRTIIRIVSSLIPFKVAYLPLGGKRLSCVRKRDDSSKPLVCNGCYVV